MELEKTLKQEIIKSAESVKKKVKQIRQSKADNDFVLETALKPIVDPLREIAKYNIQSSPLIEEGIRVKSTPANTLCRKRKHNNSDELLSSENYDSDIENTKPNKTIVENLNVSDKSDESESRDSTSESEKNDFNQSPNTSYNTADTSMSPNNLSLSWSLSSDVYRDVPFGVRIFRGKHMLGSSRIKISDSFVSVPGHECNLTPGLTELLLKKTPDLSIITASDLDNYKQLLLITNAHRRDFDSKKPIKSNKGIKYLSIIKPMFKKTKNCTSSESLTQGFGLPLMKRMKKNTDYVYWDNPNELVERLKLLVASRDAGNTGLDGEIISILNELRESGVID